MKKQSKLIIYVFIIICCFTFFSCSKKNTESGDMIEYKTGVFIDKNWSDETATYKKAIIPDKQTALETAKVFFGAMTVSEETRSFVPRAVFYDESDQIWIVSFGKDTDEPILGGECCIAMRATNAEVLRIWFTE